MFAHMEAKYDFFRFFPVRIYSCTLGANKPSPIVYLEALRGSKVQSSEAVYIDDISRIRGGGCQKSRHGRRFITSRAKVYWRACMELGVEVA